MYYKEIKGEFKTLFSFYKVVGFILTTFGAVSYFLRVRSLQSLSRYFTVKIMFFVVVFFTVGQMKHKVMMVITWPLNLLYHRSSPNYRNSSEP